MKAVAPMAMAGALCLPLSFQFTRSGAFLVTLAIVVAVSAIAAALLAARDAAVAAWKVPAAFAAGALAGESCWIAYWLLDHGIPAAGSLPMGLRVSLVEGAALATTGSVVALLVFALVRRIDRGD